jgi:hypothetical protein
MPVFRLPLPDLHWLGEGAVSGAVDADAFRESLELLLLFTHDCQQGSATFVGRFRDGD